MSARILHIVIAFAVVALGRGVAAAYPQFHLSRDASCTSCHISPAGGNLLNENGLAVSETMSSFGTAPEFMYGAIPTPSWLVLGGDLRGAAGYLKTPEDVVAAFPMQIEAYAQATFGRFAVHLNAGTRPPTVGNETATIFWAREHYLMWQEPIGESELYVRAGRFMPVFGLRLAEHTVYTRRYGGTPLYGDTYGVHGAFIGDRVEAHVTGFVEDPFIDTVEKVSGGATLVEYRVAKNAIVGGEAMIEVGDHDTKYRGGLIGKVYLEAADLLLQTELQYVLQKIEPVGAPNQIVGYLMASRMLTPQILLDVGIGHYDSNIRIGRLDRDCLDINVHWFTTSHVELVLNSRLELIGWNQGNNDPGAYAILQAHYRL
jgi:hypothetical protein